MELLYQYYFLLFAFLILSLKFLGDKLNSKKLPPGPSKLPIIGNLHQLLFGDQRLQYRLFKLAKVHGPLMHLKLGEVSAIVVSSPEVVIEVLKNQETAFATRPLLLFSKHIFRGNTIIFAPYAEYWKQMRKIFVQELLGAASVRSLSTIRSEEASILVESIMAASKSSQLVNVSERLVSFTGDLSLKAIVGTKHMHQEELLEVIKDSFSMLGGFNIADLFPSLPFIGTLTGLKFRVDRCCKKADQILQGIIEDHRESRMAEIKSGAAEHRSEENLLNVLLRLQEQGGHQIPLTDDMIKTTIFELIAGGRDTTSSTLSWAMSELMRNPRVMCRVQAEIRDALKGKTEITEEEARRLTCVQLVLKETLRMHPPAPLLGPRECREECVVLGYRIPVGTRLVVNQWAMGRDPKCWDAPDEFRPERFEGSSMDFRGKCFEFIPFGAGKRMCPGMAFGLATVELPLAQLLYHFDWKLPDGIEPHQLDMTQTWGLTVTRLTPLLLHATPYIPNPIAGT